MIELKHICKTFDSGGGEVEALKNVSLTIEKGEIYGIIGMSGAGKSTLVRCMNLLERPTSGEIWVNGKELDKMSAGELGGIGIRFVRQAHQLQKLSGPLFRVSPSHAPQLHRETHIAQASALHQEVKVLEDHGDLPAGLPQLTGGHFIQFFSVHPYFA